MTIKEKAYTSTGMTSEKLDEIGLEVLECKCKGAGCPGWTLHKTEAFDINQFNAALIR